MLGKVLGFFCTAVLLWYTLQLGLVRYFDADELAYLHWAHNVFTGSRPYYDFYFYVPSGFLYVLAPLFVFTHGASILTIARVFAFFVQIGIVLTLIILYKQWRGGSWFGLLAAILFLFLPLPKDKFLEVRPDNLAMLLSLIGLLYQVKAIEAEHNKKWWAISGFFYALSLIILPKTLPQIVVAGVVALVWWGDQWQKKWADIRSFIFGGVIPIGLFFVFQLLTAHGVSEIGLMWYSLTKLPFEVNRIAEQFPMQPDLFFYPNGTYYGGNGMSSGLLVNHLIWIVGLLFGVCRLCTPFIPRGRKGVYAEVLLAGTFFLYVTAFIFWYPLRHAQYLIPIAVFVVLYGADFAEIIWNSVKQNTFYRRVIFGLSCVALLVGFSIFRDSVSQKLLWTNSEDRRVIVGSQSLIPKDAYVFDLIGATIYFKDPYYVSALPYGQHEPYLSFTLPSLPDALEKTKTQYAYEGQLSRINNIPAKDQAYIRAHFTEILPSHFYIKK